MIGYPSPFVQVKGGSVEHSSLKRVKIILKRRALLVMCLLLGIGILIFVILEQSKWGQTLTTIFFTIVSAEVGLAKMHMDGWGSQTAFVMLIGSHAFNLGLDYVLSVLALKVPWFRGSVEVVSSLGKLMIKQIKQLIPWLKSSQRADAFDRMNNHLHDLHKRKSYWVYVLLFVSAALPKIPIPFLPGWTAPAVFFIRYNRLGLRGWIPLCAGLALRTLYDFALVYGF